MNLYLETFIEVAKNLSFSKTAKILNIPASTVSARINTLESQLGVVLFHRTTRHVSLTEKGEYFFTECSEGMRILKNAQEQILEKDLISGLVRMTIPNDFNFTKLSKIISQFTTKYDKVNVSIEVSDEQIDLVKNNIDVAFRVGKIQGPQYICRKVGESQFILCATPKYIKNNNLHNKDINKKKYIIDPTNILKSENKSNFHSTNNLKMAKEMALQSLAPVILPLEICQVEIKKKKLQEISSTFLIPKKNIYIVYPTKRLQSKKARLFIDYLMSNL